MTKFLLVKDSRRMGVESDAGAHNVDKNRLAVL